MSILDISKVHMYDFFYNHLKPKYGENMKLNFTDTDSFCLEIQTLDVYADMKENSDIFDTSNFPTNHFCIVIKIKRSLESLKMNVQITPHLNLWVSSQRCTVLIWGLQRKILRFSIFLGLKMW